ncbi:MAG: hypothetical protein AAGA67_02130, partial [Cyanobacteria bacterium P01_F01_bin.153]
MDKTPPKIAIFRRAFFAAARLFPGKRVIASTGESFTMSGRDLMIKSIPSPVTGPDSPQDFALAVVTRRGHLARLALLRSDLVITSGSLEYVQACLKAINQCWIDGNSIA